jgi:hypothetical protein
LATVPTPEEVEAAIMAGAGRYVKRPGETFPFPQVAADLQQHDGYTADELNEAFGRLLEKGWLEQLSSGVLMRITEEGFKAI